MPKVNFPNAPHTVFITIDIRTCEHKNTGEMVPVTKNKPLVFRKRFDNLEKAKEWELLLIKESDKIMPLTNGETNEA